MKAFWHVRRRNNAEVDEAWHENLILERFFVPVLDLPTYVSPNGSRWPPEQRDNIAKQVVKGAPFISTAEAYPIFVVAKGRPSGRSSRSWHGVRCLGR